VDEVSSDPATETDRVRMFVGLPFWPRLTVAVVRAEGRGSRRPAQVKTPTGPSPTKRIGWFSGVRISLYRSELQPSGLHYVPLAQVELPSGQQ
jgi:hypothetical protein